MPARLPIASRRTADEEGGVDALLKLLSTLPPEKRDLVEVDLLRALRSAGVPVRLRVAKQLARRRKCPARLVRLLAHDRDARVAAVVLSSCAGLSDEVLLELARCKDQALLEAIARRRGLPAYLSRVLVRRGDDAVLQRLASNTSASIAPSTRLRMLARLAKAHSTGSVRGVEHAALGRTRTLDPKGSADRKLRPPFS